MMNDFDLAIKRNGYTIVDDIKYAIGQKPSIGMYEGNVVYFSFGFTQEMLDNDGKHDQLCDDCVTLIWDFNPCDENGVENDLKRNWQKGAQTLEL